MTQAHLRSTSKKIFICVLFFLFLGQVLLFSATGILGLEKYNSEFYYVKRQGLLAIAGVLFMILVSWIPYKMWEKFCFLIFFSVLVLVGLTLFSHFGFHALGASRWIRFSFFSFQPSEFAKFAVPFYVAKILTLEKISKRQKFLLFIPVFLLLFMIYKAPDLGSTVLLSLVILSLFYISGVEMLPIFISLISLFFVSMLFIFTSYYRRKRLLGFIDPWGDPLGGGFQTIQSMLSLHWGKFFGQGLGNGNSKLFFLPEIHTDFIFSLLGEEMGFLGVSVLLGVFAFFFYQILKISHVAQNPYAKLVSFGLTISLMLQVLVNLAGVTGLIPLKGLPLPFLSWGRSSLMVNMFIVGVLLNILKSSCFTPVLKQRVENR